MRQPALLELLSARAACARHLRAHACRRRVLITAYTEMGDRTSAGIYRVNAAAVGTAKYAQAMTGISNTNMTMMMNAKTSRTLLRERAASRSLPPAFHLCRFIF